MADPQRLVLLREPRPKRKRTGPAEFSIPRALARADEILAGPCAGHLPRVPGVGTLVQRFVLPLELCAPQNRQRHAHAGMHAAHKEKVYRMLWLQHPSIRAKPLPGRPLIRAVRFSVREGDQLSDGFKVPIDMLCVPRPPKAPGGRSKKGLGFLVDDAPRYVFIATWWERAPQSDGFGLIEIWSGA